MAALVVHGRGRKTHYSARARRRRREQCCTFPERQELLLSWLPSAESFELPGATHLLHVENPRGMADALASFFARHPLASST